MPSRTLIVPNDHTPLDLLLFRAFGAEVPGLAEQTLAANPGLAAAGSFPPRGTIVTAAVPPSAQTQPTRPVIKLFD